MNRGNSKRHDQLLITAADVKKFLRRHPDFFQDHLDLLEDLRLPHPCGDAVSLIARQIELLREKNSRLQAQLNNIMQIARDNDALYQRLHQLSLTLLNAKDLTDALVALKWGLCQHFQTDFVSVHLADFEAPHSFADSWVNSGSGGSELLAAALDVGKPQCGGPDPEQTAFLFGAKASEVASYALVPLQHAGLRGLLAIGSRNPERFKPGMGSLFLTQLGEILSVRLAGLLDSHA